MPSSQRRQSGFTLLELIITVAIVAILGSIAIAQMRDYTRRASISEVVMAISKCKNTVAENYLTLDSAPAPGRWGCETATGEGKYAGKIETSSNGVIRVAIKDLDRVVNGQYVYLIPAKFQGNAPMTTPDDLGRGVSAWICGSDWMVVRNALPANCRTDTTTFASQDFE